MKMRSGKQLKRKKKGLFMRKGGLTAKEQQGEK